MQVKSLALLLAIGASAAFSGCGDPTAIKAAFPDIDAKPAIYALNGTTSTISAVSVRSGSAVPVDANFAFDVAMDFNAQGQVVVYTVRAVASQLVQAHPVGLQMTDKAFDAIDRAPTSGYKYDSSMVVPVGKTVFVDAIDTFSCSPYSILGQNIRAKMVIDSVLPSSRQIFLHVLSNPNCGFRSLVPGGELPKD